MTTTERKKRIIGVDFDDVLMDWNTALFEQHNSIHGTSFKVSDHTRFTLEETFSCDYKVALQSVIRLWDSDSHIDIPPLIGVIENISKLKDNELIIVTSRPERVREKVQDWLEKHLPGIFTGIYFTNQFHGGDSIRKEKAEICKEQSVEIFIDDALHNAVDIAAVGIPVLLLDSPWNQMDVLPPLITRVFSWQEIVERIG